MPKSQVNDERDHCPTTISEIEKTKLHATPGYIFNGKIQVSTARSSSSDPLSIIHLRFRSFPSINQIDHSTVCNFGRAFAKVLATCTSRASVGSFRTAQHSAHRLGGQSIVGGVCPPPASARSATIAARSCSSANTDVLVRWTSSERCCSFFSGCSASKYALFCFILFLYYFVLFCFVWQNRQINS